MKPVIISISITKHLIKTQKARKIQKPVQLTRLSPIDKGCKIEIKEYQANKI